MDTFKAIFSSKKFYYTLVAVAVAVVGQLAPQYSDMVSNVLNSMIALVVGQGIADVGKNLVK